MVQPIRIVLLVLACIAVSGCSEGGEDVKAPSGRNLRAKLSLDLDEVRSFVVMQTQQVSARPLMGASTWGISALPLPGQSLFALTVDGNLVPVPLTEGGETGASSASEPIIEAIHPTPGWIFFSTKGFQLAPLAGEPDPRPCPTIVARRSDGALFCTQVGIATVNDTYGNVGPLAASVRASASGDVVYLASYDELSRLVLYRFTADNAGNPAAELVDSALHPQWFVVNASGDLLTNVRPPNAADGVTVTSIRPRAGGVFTLEGEDTYFAAAGDPGTATEDSFFVVSEGECCFPFRAHVRAVHKGPTGFVELPSVVTMDETLADCRGLFRLTGGLAMFCHHDKGMTLARVVENGAVVSKPTNLPLVGLASEKRLLGWSYRHGGGRFYVLGKGGDGPVLVRHDGVQQTNIPIDPRIEVLGFHATASGDLHLLGTYTDSDEKVRAVAAVGADTLAIVEVAGIKVAEALVFVQIQ